MKTPSFTRGQNITLHFTPAQMEYWAQIGLQSVQPTPGQQGQQRTALHSAGSGIGTGTRRSAPVKRRKRRSASASA